MEVIATKRQSYDIKAELLSLAMKSSRKTRLMYRANLSYRQLAYYLADLLAKGLLQRTNNPHPIFQTTRKGKDWLEVYKQLEVIENG